MPMRCTVARAGSVSVQALQDEPTPTYSVCPLIPTELVRCTSPSEFGATTPVRTDAIFVNVALVMPVVYALRYTPYCVATNT